MDGEKHEAIAQELREGFVRQRRNLVLMSTALFFFEIGGMTFSKLDILGNETEITNPFLFHVALWVVFGYFFLRYWNYFSQMAKDEMSDLFHSYLLAAVYSYVIKTLMGKFDPKKVFDGDWEAFGEASAQIEREGPNEFEGSVVTMIRDSKGLPRGPVSAGTYDLKGRDLRRHKIKAAILVSLNTRIFTEFLLPFVLALGPVAGLAVRLWAR